MWLAACSSGLAAVAAPLRPRIATESFRCYYSNIQWQLMLQHWQFFFSGLERAADTNVKQKGKSSASITAVAVSTRSRLAIDSTSIPLNPSFDSDSKGICLDELLQCLVRIGFGHRVGWVVMAVDPPNLK